MKDDNQQAKDILFDIEDVDTISRHWQSDENEDIYEYFLEMAFLGETMGTMEALRLRTDEGSMRYWRDSHGMEDLMETVFFGAVSSTAT